MMKMTKWTKIIPCTFLKHPTFPLRTDENREDIAVFLIRSGCDVNAVRKPGLGGAGGDEATDLMTPLHLCCSWGLEETAQALIEHGAKVNAKVGASGRQP